MDPGLLVDAWRDHVKSAKTRAETYLHPDQVRIVGDQRLIAWGVTGGVYKALNKMILNSDSIFQIQNESTPWFHFTHRVGMDRLQRAKALLGRENGRFTLTIDCCPQV